MTVKDLRLNYKGHTKNAPFDDGLNIDIDNYNHDDVEAYIEYLEELYLAVNELKSKLIPKEG